MGYEPGDLDDLVGRLRAGRLPAAPRRRRIREAAGVSLRDAASTLGVATMTLHRWERGTHPRKLEDAIRYRELLDRLEELDA